MDTHLFLFGSGPPFLSSLAKHFAFLVKDKGRLCSVLFISRPGWKTYRPNYMRELEQYGFEFVFLSLPATSTYAVIDELRRSEAIIIGGGVTDRYIDEIVETSIGGEIKRLFYEGKPVAGFSAGALISMEESILSPQDNDEQIMKRRDGLGLMVNTALAVHYSEWGEEAHLLKMTNCFKKKNNYGIDERTGIYVQNNVIQAVEGIGGVYEVRGGQISLVKCQK